MGLAPVLPHFADHLPAEAIEAVHAVALRVGISGSVPMAEREVAGAAA